MTLVDSATAANGQRVVAAVPRRFGQGGLLARLRPGVATWALWRYHWPTVAQTQKSPPRQCRAGRREAFDATS